jgi:hypothetical protein
MRTRPVISLGGRRILMLLGWSVLAAFCLSAIGVHIDFLSTLPDPIFFPDSVGYLGPAIHWITDGLLRPPPFRTVGYPLFLGLLIRGTGTLYAVLLIQHLLALSTAVLSGWFSYRYCRASRPASILVFALAAALPRAVVYSHAIMAEILYGFFLVCGVFAFCEGLHQSSVKWSAVSAVFIWMSIVTRPVGKSVLLLLMLLSVYGMVLRPQVRRVMSGFLISSLFVGMMIGTWNRVYRGFWDVDQIGPIAAFGVLARFVDVPSIADPRVRETLAPIYIEDHRDLFLDAGWVRSGAGGPGAALSKLIPDPKGYDDQIRSLCRQALFHHPFGVAQLIISQSAQIVFYLSRRPSKLIPLVYTISNSTARWGEFVRNVPAAKTMIVFRPEESARFFSDIARRRIYPFDCDTPAGTFLFPWVFVVGVLPITSLLLSGILLYQSDTRMAASVLLLTIGGQIVAIALAGADARYTLPMEPLYLILAGGGLSALIQYVPFIGGKRTDSANPGLEKGRYTYPGVSTGPANE